MPKGKPNILVIWGDDIGITNLSCYSDGLMGYQTPNIDRIANEGALLVAPLRATERVGEPPVRAIATPLHEDLESAGPPARRMWLRALQTNPSGISRPRSDRRESSP